jgi:two-component system response regulator WspF
MDDVVRQEALPLIAIGGSTGAPMALAKMLRMLPKDFSGAILIAQHLDEAYAKGLVDVLDKICDLPVIGAVDGQAINAGCVMVSQSNSHLVINHMKRICYRHEPEAQLYRPSVDELFASLALYWPGPLCAVLLSGMGADGAKGLLALRRLGKYTIAQAESSCAVYGMPKAAGKLNAAIEALPPEGIVERIIEWTKTIENGSYVNGRG